MSKIAEQKALEAYPDVTLEECHGDIKMMKYCNSDNPSLREGYSTGYQQGYDQALQDFMEKAMEYFKGKPIHHFWVEHFKNYMEEEL